MIDEQHEVHLHLTNIIALCALRGLEADARRLRGNGLITGIGGVFEPFEDPTDAIAGLVEVAETIVNHIEALDDNEIPDLCPAARIIVGRIKEIAK